MKLQYFHSIELDFANIGLNSETLELLLPIYGWFYTSKSWFRIQITICQCVFTVGILKCVKKSVKQIENLAYAPKHNFILRFLMLSFVCIANK